MYKILYELWAIIKEKKNIANMEISHRQTGIGRKDAVSHWGCFGVASNSYRDVNVNDLLCYGRTLYVPAYL